MPGGRGVPTAKTDPCRPGTAPALGLRAGDDVPFPIADLHGRPSMLALVFGMVLLWLLIALGAGLGYQLVRQNGRVLLRLESIEDQLRPRGEARRRQVGGLPVGTAAPDFELPDLAGVRRRLSDFRDKPVLLIFFNPGCGYCTRMAA